MGGPVGGYCIGRAPNGGGRPPGAGGIPCGIPIGGLIMVIPFMPTGPEGPGAMVAVFIITGEVGSPPIGRWYLGN